MMNKFVFSAAVILFIGACAIPLPTLPLPSPSPVVDTVGTAGTNLETSVVQTLTAQPTVTPVIVESTVTPTVFTEATISPTAIPASETPAPVVDTASPIPTGTFDIPTATEFPATQALADPTTASRTSGPLTYGTLPPAVPFSYVTLINRAETQAYISLQVTTEQGGPTIIEYPVRGRIEIQAPVGHYLYVAWVGGRKMVGEFRLHKNEDLSIILYRDRIVIK
jgi:hypothetical protein